MARMWIPERDSQAAKDGTYISEKQIKEEIEADLRKICRETGAKRYMQLVAEERTKLRPIGDLPGGSTEHSAPLPLGPPKKVKVEKVKVPKPEKPKKPTAPEGWITIGEWCKKWGIDPPDARAALRGSNMTKPEFGWAFDPKREKEIKKICGVKK